MSQMYRTDKLLERHRAQECYQLLHRAAGMRNYSCDPKKSYIDGRYFAEINHYSGKGVMVMNVKMGTGETPIEAVIDGYRQAIPLDDMMAVLYLECELFLLSETVRVYGKLEKAMDDLIAVIFPHVVINSVAGMFGLPYEEFQKQYFDDLISESTEGEDPLIYHE